MKLLMQGDPYTLVVALDKAGKASGEVYLDDGKTFAYERGVFAHRVLSFDGNTLTNAPLPGASSRKEYRPENEIERIIVLGLPSKQTSWTVSVDGSSSQLEAAAGPLSLRPGLPDCALVVRKPGLNAAADWSLSFSLGSSNA